MRYLFLLFLFLSANLVAQTHQYEAWLAYDLDKKLNKELSVSFAQELRAEVVYQDLEGAISKLSLNYEVKKWLKTVFAYRLDLVRPLSQRLEWNNQSKHSIKKHDFYQRIRIQSAWELNDIRPEMIVRYRPKFKYKINKKYDLSLSVESYFEVEEQFHLADEIRTQLSFAIDMGKRKTLELFILNSSEINEANPNREWVVGMVWEMGFK